MERCSGCFGGGAGVLEVLVVRGVQEVREAWEAREVQGVQGGAGRCRAVQGGAGGADLREQPLLLEARISAARRGGLPRLRRVAREDVERAARRRGQFDEHPLPPLERELLQHVDLEPADHAAGGEQPVQLGLVRAAAHVEAARAAEELELGVAETLGEGLVGPPRRLGGADALQQREELDRPAERRRASEHNAAPRRLEHGQQQLGALRILRLEVVCLVGDGHTEAGGRDVLQQPVLLLAVGHYAVGEHRHPGAPKLGVVVRADEVDVARRQEGAPALELLAPGERH